MKQNPHAGMFLAKVRVRRFAEVQKSWEKVGDYGQRGNVRRLVTRENKNSDDVFVVVGVTTIPEGWSDYLSYEEGYVFRQTASRQVYIVAKSIGRRFKALPEDIEVIEHGQSSRGDG